MVGTRLWALVSNGVRARILKGLENSNSEEPIELISKTEATHLRDIVSDKSGRSFASAAGGRRSAMEPGSDPILRDMQDFASETLEVLEQHLRAGDFKRLAIVAAPKMLGILRQQMSAALRETVVLERSVNLGQLPERELRETVLELLRGEPKK